jgi:ankyrin repeat protein
MTNKTNNTPYYPVQHLLREFAKGLGTKASAGKKIDDACKSLEINPFHLEALKKSLIHDPLTECVNIYFADHVLSQFEKVLETYVSLVKTIPLGGVNKDLSRQLIDRYFMTFAVADVCSSALLGMQMTARDIARSENRLVGLALERFEDSPEWQEFLTNSSESQKECIRAWRSPSKVELPKLKTIDLLGKECQRGNSWAAFKARLIIARLWDYFFYRSGYTDIALLKKYSSEDGLKMLGNQLVSLREQVEHKCAETTSLALELHDLLRSRKTRGEGDKTRIGELLQHLKPSQALEDNNNSLTYYYHWMNARYLLYSGELKSAVEQYKLAFEQVVYRQSEDTSQIISEALVVSCRSPKPDKKFINRLRRFAVLMKLDLMPAQHNIDDERIKPEEIESWEIAAFSESFNSCFTKESFFNDAPYPENPYPSQRTWNVKHGPHQVELEKLNGGFSVRTEGGKVQDIPQLAYFAMKEDTDTVSKLLEHGANVNCLTSDGESAILFAVQSMQVNQASLNSMNDELFRLLSANKHLKSTLNALTNKRKLSPLGCSVQTGRVDIVDTLLEMGAEVDMRHDIIGETPLYTAIGMIAHHTRPKVNQVHWKNMRYSDMNLQSTRAYSSGGLPHDLVQLKKAMMTQDTNPLFQKIHSVCVKLERENIMRYSTAEGFRQIAKLLIEKGADPNAKHETAMIGYTPLMLAIELDEAELVEAMMESKHYAANLEDTCIDSNTGQRVDIKRIIREWRATNVDKVLSERT